MSTILVDMDGVLAWWEKHLIDQVRTHHPEIEVFDFGTRTHADASRLASIYENPHVREIMATPGFYRHLEPVAGGIAALNEMLAAGLDVAICTAPSLYNTTCASDKYAWVAEHMGWAWQERVVITRDKTRVRGDILIDDKVHVRGAITPEWTHVIFDQSYNRVELERPRLVGWANWRTMIEPLLG